MVGSHPKCLSTNVRADTERLGSFRDSASIRCIARAMDFSPCGQHQPAPAWATSSPRLVSLVNKQGMPWARASRTACGMPSQREVWQKTAAPCKRRSFAGPVTSSKILTSADRPSELTIACILRRPSRKSGPASSMAGGRMP